MIMLAWLTLFVVISGFPSVNTAAPEPAEETLHVLDAEEEQVPELDNIDAHGNVEATVMPVTEAARVSTDKYPENIVPPSPAKDGDGE